MLVVVAVLLALLVLPSPWGLVAVVCALLAELGEISFWLRWNRRRRPQVGAETLIGASAEVVAPCDPDGTVRVAGELWQARCEPWATAGATVVVRERDGLTLVVEPRA